MCVDDRSSDEADGDLSDSILSEGSTSLSSEGAEKCQTTRMFTCPEQSCTKTFIRYSALERHCEFGAHTRSLKRVNLQDQAKISYANHLQEGQTRKQQSVPVNSAAATYCASDKCQMGWALKSSAKKLRFSEKQKKFLDAKFNLGEQTGEKSSGEDVARQMRRARGEDGKRLFAVDKFLTPQQITSYFSRMAAKRKSVPEAELENEERAVMFHEVAEEISASLTTMQEEEQSVSEVDSCCFTYKKMALCCMTKDQLRAKLTLPNLKSICRKYGIQGVSGGRKKEPYVDALSNFISTRPCTLHRT